MFFAAIAAVRAVPSMAVEEISTTVVEDYAPSAACYECVSDYPPTTSLSYAEEECEDEEFQEKEEKYEETNSSEVDATYIMTKTMIYTITACPTTIYDCPYGETSTEVITTTWCPVNMTTNYDDYTMTVTTCPGYGNGYGCHSEEATPTPHSSWSNNGTYTHTPCPSEGCGYEKSTTVAPTLSTVCDVCAEEHTERVIATENPVTPVIAGTGRTKVNILAGAAAFFAAVL